MDDELGGGVRADAGERRTNVAGAEIAELVADGAGGVEGGFALGDGDDVVAIGAGTDVLVQLAARPDGGSDPKDYTLARDGDRMTLHFASGSITFTGVQQAGTIAIARGFSPAELLRTPEAPVDIRV